MAGGEAVRTYTDDDGSVETLVLEFDDRDDNLDEDTRRIILLAHAAGLESARAMRQVKKDNPDASEAAMHLAPQIFAQALGASLGLTFRDGTMAMMAQVLLCARVANMTEEERTETLRKLGTAAEQIIKARH